MDNYLRFARINIPRNCRNIPENWLVMEILSLAKYPTPGKQNVQLYAENKGDYPFTFMKLMGKDGKRLSISQFCTVYEQRERLTGYFVKRKTSNKFGEIKPIMQTLEQTKLSESSKLSIAENETQKDIPEQ